MISRRSLLLAAPAIVACSSLMSLRGVKMAQLSQPGELVIGWTGTMTLSHPVGVIYEDWPSGTELAFLGSCPDGWREVGTGYYDTGDSFLIGRKL